MMNMNLPSTAQMLVTAKSGSGQNQQLNINDASSQAPEPSLAASQRAPYRKLNRC